MGVVYRAEHVLSKKKLAIIKKAIRVANAGSQADQGEAGWSIEEMLMDSRAKSPGTSTDHPPHNCTRTGCRR